jgi:hypothetical protein
VTEQQKQHAEQSKNDTTEQIPEMVKRIALAVAKHAQQIGEQKPTWYVISITGSPPCFGSMSHTSSSICSIRSIVFYTQRERNESLPDIAAITGRSVKP